ncbi:MptD family putative ECF transporter S component [Salinispora tropica]|uniref:Uncharacterized protein n=1 Tax=Salinispora tropica (strain ATCC BAA-916 / DSM 44818 / JCM 13857 / NBRC 105044 / CNB-440) TaxID=369723 RepID=A4XCE2_SALTO|nr:MptD family putative ECF transporter S component [Salinispora tropica]ABP56599.1 hypothetical protein Strop_4170 [Salinispora tropica CNB-440]
MSINTRTSIPPRPKLPARFSARDLLNTAMFAVILIVVTSTTGMLGIVAPLVWLCTVLLQALVSGVPVMLLTLLTLSVLGVVALIILVAGSGGGLIGSAILRKYVVRAGLA